MKINEIPDGFEGVDAGPDSRKAFADVLKSSKTILMNGPVGAFENPKFAEGTKAVLEDLGFCVDIAKSSEYLIKKIKYGEKYDIIFSNNIYRDGTGPECLKKLKEIKGFSIPVVIHTVTKNARDNFVNEIGFDDYIEKPVTREKLMPILKKIFDK